jgi:quinol monooxygenase YgiN
MPFIQVIEFSTTKPDEIRKLVDDFRSSTEGERTVVKGTICADRDQPDRYVNIVEFESYDEAMRNSNLPETTELAARMAELCDGPPSFRNLDVIDSFEG